MTEPRPAWRCSPSPASATATAEMGVDGEAGQRSVTQASSTTCWSSRPRPRGHRSGPQHYERGHRARRGARSRKWNCGSSRTTSPSPERCPTDPAGGPASARRPLRPGGCCWAGIHGCACGSHCQPSWMIGCSTGWVGCGCGYWLLLDGLAGIGAAACCAAGSGQACCCGWAPGRSAEPAPAAGSTAAGTGRVRRSRARRRRAATEAEARAGDRLVAVAEEHGVGEAGERGADQRREDEQPELRDRVAAREERRRPSSGPG